MITVILWTYFRWDNFWVFIHTRGYPAQARELTFHVNGINFFLLQFTANKHKLFYIRSNQIFGASYRDLFFKFILFLWSKLTALCQNSNDNYFYGLLSQTGHRSHLMHKIYFQSVVKKNNLILNSLLSGKINYILRTSNRTFWNTKV